MTFKTIDKKDISFFKNLLGERCLIDSDNLSKYGHDETEDLLFLPEIVLKPETTEEVSIIMKYAFENSIVVTPSGARTGLSGGSLPIHKGIALSMERFNKILKI